MHDCRKWDDELSEHEQTIGSSAAHCYEGIRCEGQNKSIFFGGHSSVGQR